MADSLPSDAADALSVQMGQPATPLRNYISAYFISEIDASQPVIDYSVPEWGALRLVLDGAFDIELDANRIERMSGPYVQGPSSRPFKFSLQKFKLLGIGIMPVGFARFWDFDTSSIANSWTPLAALDDTIDKALPCLIGGHPSVEDLFSRVDTYFLNLLQTTKPTHQFELTVQLHKLLNNPDISRIEDLAEAMQLSQSTLASLCKKRFGFAPKLLLRRQRFLRMLAALQARPYSEWPDYIDPQYADQSHMIRDFKYFMGMSPRQYLALPRPVQKLSAIKRTEAVGGSLQGLA